MFDNFSPAVCFYTLGYMLFVAIRAKFDKGPLSGSDMYGSRWSELLIMAVTGLGVMLLPLLFVATPFLNRFNYAPWAPLQMVGVLLLLAGLLLFWVAHRELGKSFSRTLEIHTDHRLVTTGVYRRVRHPIYAAIWLIVLAQLMLLPNWLAGPSGLAGFGVMYFARVRREEAMMLDHFGQPYRHHLRVTGRLFPKAFGPSRGDYD